MTLGSWIEVTETLASIVRPLRPFDSSQYRTRHRMFIRHHASGGCTPPVP